MKIRGRRLMSVDIDHLAFLHREAAEQLDLLLSVAEAAEQTAGTSRDILERIIDDHWQAYLEILHLLCLHDQEMDAVLKKNGLNIREEDIDIDERQAETRRTSPQVLITALSRRHRRLQYIYGLNTSPMTEYLRDTLIMEREHIAELVVITEQAL